MFDKLLTLAVVVKDAALSEDTEAFLRAVSEYAAEGADLVAKLRAGGGLLFGAADGGVDKLAACDEVLDECCRLPTRAVKADAAAGFGPVEFLELVAALKKITDVVRRLLEKRQG